MTRHPTAVGPPPPPGDNPTPAGEYVAALRAMADAALAGSPPTPVRDAQQRFGRVLELEVQFWEMAFSTAREVQGILGHLPTCASIGKLSWAEVSPLCD